MSIVYSCVAHGSEIYSQAGTSSAINKWNTAIQGLLLKVDPHTRKSYEYERCSINYISESERTFVAVAEKQLNTRIAFAFLEKLRSLYSGSNVSRFEEILAEQMGLYSQAQVNDRILSVQQEIATVKEIMMENISTVLKRGEKLEDLVDKTDNIALESAAFKTNAIQLKRAMWWKNIKLWIMVIIVAVVLISILAVIIYNATK